MTELDSVDRLLELARAEFSPSGADKLRTRAALRQPDAAARGARRQQGASSWQAVRASSKARGLVALVLLGAVFGAGYWLGQRTPEPLQPRAAAAASEGSALPGAAWVPPVLLGKPVPAAPPVRGLEQPPVQGPEPSRERGARAPAVPAPARRHATTPAAPGAVPVDELSLLRRVERALRGAEPALALALLAELEERFPRTSLAEERAAAAVMAHCGLADAGAQQRAQSFLRDQAASVYAERVRAACEPANVGRGESREGSPRAGHE